MAANAPRSIESLKLISKGPRLLEEEGTQGGSIVGRNTTFELFCAARFARLGLDVSFNTMADATLQIGGERVALECKRLSNIEMFERNVELAANQVRRRIQACQAVSGIAAVSISWPIHEVLIEQGIQPIGRRKSCRNADAR